MKCKCGFQFAGPGEFRNCAAFVTKEGESGVVCPECGRDYIEGREVRVHFPGNQEADDGSHEIVSCK